MPADRVELAWASGLFEGEGCTASPGVANPGLQLGMTDEDTVRRFQRAVGIGVVEGPFGPYVGSPGRKPMWRWRANAFEDTQAVIALLWEGFGVRRRKQAVELMAYRKTRRPRARNGRGKRRAAWLSS